MIKQEKIKEAYGADVWSIIDESVKENILENQGGWTYEINESWLQKTKGIEIEINGKYCRPKALQGIEDNNGWTKIESKRDLPKEEIDCFFVKDKLMYNGVWDNVLKGFFFRLQKINATHYHQIKRPEPPIY